MFVLLVLLVFVVLLPDVGSHCTPSLGPCSPPYVMSAPNNGVPILPGTTGKRLRLPVDDTPAEGVGVGVDVVVVVDVVVGVEDEGFAFR